MHTVRTDTDMHDVAVLWLTYEQEASGHSFTKTLDDIEIDSEDPTIFRVRLTQKETLGFRYKVKPNNVEIQARAKMLDGTARASKVRSISIERILKDGEI